LFACALVVGCDFSAPPEPADPRFADAMAGIGEDTNILIVSFDALRADALGVYGYELDTSPNIDEWAAEAFVFERFYVAAQATPTSFAAAFTGQWPFRVFRGWQLFDTQTLAEVMQRSGRETFAIFNNVQLVEERNFDQGFDDYRVLRVQPDRQVVAEAGEVLATYRDRPFFGWVHFISPHTPYSPRRMAEHFYSPGYEGPYEQDSGRNPDPPTEADARRLRELYDGEVYFADFLFAQLLARLNELGLDRNTLVILTADHGDQFGEKGGYGHKVVYEGVIRVPFIVRPPGGTAEQVRIDRVHANTDLLPTLAAATGAEFVATQDGFDMAAETSADRLFVYTAMTNKDNQAMAARVGDEKLVIECPPPEFSEELYDLAVDPTEQRNLVLDRPRRAGRLFDALVDEIGGDPCKVVADAQSGAEMTERLDDETIEKLRSLGYIQ
jgi:arylsulfatase A-like enzyme